MTIEVVNDVPKDLVTDSITDLFTTDKYSIDLFNVIFSLNLSNITIVSFTEYPITVKIPTIKIEFTVEPKNKLNQHRKLINLFQGLINNYKIKSKLLEAQDKEQIFQIFLDWENSNLNII